MRKYRHMHLKILKDEGISTLEKKPENLKGFASDQYAGKFEFKFIVKFSPNAH